MDGSWISETVRTENFYILLGIVWGIAVGIGFGWGWRDPSARDLSDRLTHAAGGAFTGLTAGVVPVGIIMLAVYGVSALVS